MTRAEITRKRKSMKATVASMTKYMATYDQQAGYLDYSNEIYIEDVLYGLGISLSEDFRYAEGFRKFKEVLRKHFESARAEAARLNPAMADQIKRMWFTKLRSKAADDVADERGEQAASDLLGHDDVRTTRRHYLTRGKRVGPTK